MIVRENLNLYELRTELENAKTGEEFVSWCVENGLKDSLFYHGYIAGVVDALYWSKKITQELYTEVYNSMGL